MKLSPRTGWNSPAPGRPRIFSGVAAKAGTGGVTTTESTGSATTSAHDSQPRRRTCRPELSRRLAALGGSPTTPDPPWRSRPATATLQLTLEVVRDRTPEG